MKVLVTGANGFVGPFLIKELEAHNHSVVALTKELVDLREPDQIASYISEAQPDAVIHLAALSHVPTCNNDFAKTLAVNVYGTENVLRAVINLKQKCKFIFASTAHVYGSIEAKDLPISEDCPTAPNNNYALSKLLAEEVVFKYARTSDLDYVIFRPFNHIGPGQTADFVVPSFVQQIKELAKLPAEERIIKTGNLEAYRDFSDVRDIVRAYRLALERGSGIYNLCYGQAVQIQQILNQLQELMNVDFRHKIDPARMRPVDIPKLEGDYAKAQKALGWRPEISLTESLKDIIASE